METWEGMCLNYVHHIHLLWQNCDTALLDSILKVFECFAFGLQNKALLYFALVLRTSIWHVLADPIGKYIVCSCGIPSRLFKGIKNGPTVNTVSIRTRRECKTQGFGGIFRQWKCKQQYCTPNTMPMFETLL